MLQTLTPLRDARNAAAQAAAGAPPRVQLIELGPGKGTMMADMLRAMKQLPIFPALSVHMVEGVTPFHVLSCPRACARSDNVASLVSVSCLSVHIVEISAISDWQEK